MMGASKAPFCITSDRQAEWALGKITEAKAEAEKWDAFYESKKEAARKECQNTIDYMTDLLYQYFSTQERRITKTGIEKYSLPSADLICRPGRIDYLRDEEKLLAWCEKNLPEAVQVTRKAGWAKVKAHMLATGEIPDSVKPYETSPTFTIKEKTDER